MEVMDDDDQLQVLTGKTWDLHVRINEKISQKGFSFCSHCSNHGRYCVVAEGSLEERDKMMAIRDSLKDVHNILVFLKRAKSSQKRQRDEALVCLEESRRLLIESINQCSEKGRKLHVLRELITFLGDGKADEFPWNFRQEMDEKIGQKTNANGLSSFLVHSTKFALEFAVTFVSIYTTVKWAKSRQQRNTDHSNIGLNVLCGRG